jgi:hypothetical protein
MAIGIELAKQIQHSVDRRNRENANHFCRLAQSGAEFVNVIYPTGFRTVIAKANGQKAEVSLTAAKTLRAAGYKIAT